MKTSFGRTVILVEDYDKAYDFYHKNFFCKKIFDATMPDGQRYLHIGFSEDDTVGIWFLKADAENQHTTVGKQTAGQPTLVIYTNQCEDLYHYLKSNNVTIIEELVISDENKFFHCLDLYGNRLIIVELPS